MSNSVELFEGQQMANVLSVCPGYGNVSNSFRKSITNAITDGFVLTSFQRMSEGPSPDDIKKQCNLQSQVSLCTHLHWEDGAELVGKD